MGHNLVTDIAQRVAAIEDQVIAWRRDLHAHPELGCREFRTSALVADHLRGLGFDEVRVGSGGGTGVIGVLRGARPGPTVALRADMDALPIEENTCLPFASTVRAEWGGREVPVMHACGHDAHTAILMGAAQILAGMRADLAGTVVALFQPAEEGPPPDWVGASGAELMVEEGALDDLRPDALFGLHVVAGTPSETRNRLSFHRGAGGYAMRRFLVTITGQGGHASMPWQTIDPLVVAAQTVLALQTIPSRRVNVYDNHVTLSVGQFHAGENFNVIPKTAMFEGALRFTDVGARAALERAFTDIVDHTARAAGAVAAIDWQYWCPPLINDPRLADLAATALRKAVDDDALVVEAPPFALDDFAHFSLAVPSLFYTLDVPPAAEAGRGADGHHMPGFMVDEATLATGVRAMLHLTLDRLAAGPGWAGA